MERNYKSELEGMEPEDKYASAKRKVKRLKGFYTHLIVYVAINIVIVFINIRDLDAGESYFKIENFLTAFFWGIGLLAHALSTFMPNWIFGKNWEDKKIKEFMEKEKSEKWE
ncbi:2TM domain-containing protein [Flavobacterium ranwuense]|uniref:2TM domain-containing protein n=1 Tax=Flavobacterium ranwuense TaxID=2541725 RepID=A0ABY2DTV3_9FLAO|nr:2TM domain-containing protein [Flavobacterium ranwuense]TDE30344.1 2TM domain-containing protein [Flavobacterium ranwuense]